MSTASHRPRLAGREIVLVFARALLVAALAR